MSYELVDMGWDASGNSTDILVLLRLAKHASDSGDSCFPSLEHLAEMTRHSERQVQRSLARLRAAGWIATQRRGRGRTSNFVLNVAKIRAAHLEAERARQAKRDSRREKGDTHDVSTKPKGDMGDVSLELKGDTHDVFSDSAVPMTRHARPDDTTSAHVDTTSVTQKHDMGVTLNKSENKSGNKSGNLLEASPRKIDPRFELFKQKYLDWYKSINNGLEDRWTAKEGAVLNQLLTDIPTLNFAHWQSILIHRGRSCVPHGEGFALWGHKATKWVSEPVDEGYISTTVRNGQRIKARFQERDEDPERGLGLDELFGLRKTTVIEGTRAALPAPAGASGGERADRNHHPRLSAVPAASTAPAQAIGEN